MDGIELVIFDCDGVLVDSERLIVDVEVQLFGELGVAFTRDDVIREFVGLSDEAMRARLVELTGTALPEDWDVTYTKRCREALSNDLQAVEGVEQVLDHLDRRGIRTCIASSGSHDKMSLTLGGTGLLDRFAGRIFSSTDPGVAAGKPAPDLFLHAAAGMGVDPSRCAVIEDSPFGVAAALAADMAAYGFAGSVVPADRLATDGAVVFHSMAELPDLLHAC